jgi:hypothetical protein
MTVEITRLKNHEKRLKLIRSFIAAEEKALGVKLDEQEWMVFAVIGLLLGLEPIRVELEAAKLGYKIEELRSGILDTLKEKKKDNAVKLLTEDDQPETLN